MKLSLKNIVLLMLMLITTATAVLMQPTIKTASLHPRVDFEALLPLQFGDWIALPFASFAVMNPVQAEALTRFYSQVVTRTYANGQGYRIMLSLAYGEVQTDSMRVHSPEICYPAQGFTVSRSSEKWIELADRNIPVTQVVATLSNRVEPLTYMISVGDSVITPDSTRKIAQLAYGLRGQIPDGLLLRVSSVDSEIDKAYEIQEKFLQALNKNLNPENRKTIFGIK